MDQSNTFCDDSYENDDSFTFLLGLKAINVHSSQFVKYSKRIRDKFLFLDVVNKIPQILSNFKKELQMSSDNILYFFQLLWQNYIIKKNENLSYSQCVELLKISKYFEVRKLSSQINQYIKSMHFDIDFLIQMIQYEVKNQNETENYQIEICSELENVLASQIDKCFSNEKFAELPISIIHRIIKQSSLKKISQNTLFDFIKKSVSKFYILFTILDLQELCVICKV